MRVALYGAGQVSQNVAAILTRRTGVETLGPFRREDRALALSSAADVVVIATTSFLRDIAEDVRAAIGAGSNVITTAEEAAFPWAVDALLGDELDVLARGHGVTVLGAGLNPGFPFDALLLTAMGPAPDVETVRVERVVDLAGFGDAVKRRIGIGWTRDEFEAGRTSGTITGHIGFPQSMRIVARRLGVELERVDREIEAIFGDDGRTGGFEQHYVGITDGRPWFRAFFTGHVDLDSIGRTPRDEIWIDGSVPLHYLIEPGLNPQTGSAAMIANSLRRVVEAPAGWLTVADLPPATPF
jgi:4-hydroxy-tetrahydrodipicolinate reductase